MGYYSEVGIALKKDDFNDLLKAAETVNDIHIRQQTLDFIRSNILHELEEAVILKWDSVKWYSCFPEVKLIEKFLDDVEEYEFIRIGESYTDVETRWSDELGYLDIRRDIVVFIDG